MEKDRSTRIIAIAALLVGIIGISLGFAFVASQLTISSSAEVTPVDDFHVYFSSSANSLATNAVPGVGSDANVTATSATIDNTTSPKQPTITNLHATFTLPGQYATYSFYAYNDNDYVAYLKSLVFANTTPTCTAKNAADQTSVTAACAGITLSISVGSGATAITNQTTSIATITNHTLASKSTEPIVVKIDYASNAAKASGDFDVTFGDITLTYDTVDNT
ncbi:MAG: hypothetical protein IKE75_05165 [Bacilli bacterium]|nr:hypothetical protein [Bacilli bacterium]